MAAFDVSFSARDAVAFHGVRSVGVQFAAPAVDASLPVISNVTPAEGVERDPTTGVIGFDVTDAGGNLTKSNVLAYYPSLGTFEVVYFSTSFDSFVAGFGPQYSGTRTAIAGGFRFSDVIRRGGWPGAPTILADPVDDAGNGSA